MLTKKEIKEQLKKDPYWQLPDDSSQDEWDAYDEAYEELEEAGELKFSDFESDDDSDDDAEDDDWDDDELL